MNAAAPPAPPPPAPAPPAPPTPPVADTPPNPRLNPWEPVHLGAGAPLPTQDTAFSDLKDAPPRDVTLQRIGVCAKLTVRGHRFDKCDFSDCTESTFEGMTFKQSSFHSAKITSVKFKSCKFEECTFSYSSFQKCIFMDCIFANCWASNEFFAIDHCDISARAFVRGIAAFTTYTNPKTRKDGTPLSRWEGVKRLGAIALGKLKAEVTRAKIARKILVSVEQSSTEELFDEAFGVVALRAARSRMASVILHRLWFLRVFGLPFLGIDFAFSAMSGIITGWRTGVVRPLVFGGLLAGVFAAVYHRYFGIEQVESVVRSLEITLVAGYGDYKTDKLDLHCVQLLNLLAGLYWFSLVTAVVFRRSVRG